MGGEGGNGEDDASLPPTIPGTLEDTALAPANTGQEQSNVAPAISPSEHTQVDPKPTVPASPGPSAPGEASGSHTAQETLAVPEEAPKASVPPAVPDNGDGEGDEPEMTGTMYTDGTYWKICVCIHV